MEHLIESHENTNPFVQALHNAEELIESAEKPSAEEATEVFRKLCHEVEANLNELTQFDFDRIRAIVDQHKETQEQAPFIAEPHLARITALLDNRQNRDKAEKADIPKDSIGYRSDAFTEAINKAGQAVEQYQNYLDANQDDSETAEHPRPSDERMVDVFFELQNEIYSNLPTLEVEKFSRIIVIISGFIEMEHPIPQELSNCLVTIMILCHGRKELGHLFKGKEGTA